MIYNVVSLLPPSSNATDRANRSLLSTECFSSLNRKGHRARARRARSKRRESPGFASIIAREQSQQCPRSGSCTAQDKFEAPAFKSNVKTDLTSKFARDQLTVGPALNARSTSSVQNFCVTQRTAWPAHFLTHSERESVSNASRETEIT